MLKDIRHKIKNLLAESGAGDEVELSIPPNPEMGDFAFACFGLAKEFGENPNDTAKRIGLKVKDKASGIIERIEMHGPYVNFFVDSNELAKMAMEEIDEDFGKLKIGEEKNIIVEFAHPNTHKAFHIGHLRNIVTGESIVRILENAGYKVTRANYQGDVGMHIAKCLYAIFKNHKEEILDLKSEPLKKRIEFIGQVYAEGARAFEKNKEAKQEIEDLNTKIYVKDGSIRKIYELTRGWSLEYFDNIYKRVGSYFDRLYFESEVFARGAEIVEEFVKQGVFKESRGAIIFEGSRYGLHDRVFINSRGHPTYEAKDMALAELQFKEYAPEKIIHVVGKEQTDYFKVIFKALELIMPESADKEKHLDYGWVHLKEGKMSSRTGNVVLGEWLLDEVEKSVKDIMGDRKLEGKDELIKKVGLAAVKYSFLKTSVDNDIKFDLKESVSLSGDSGPYLLYIVARIKSIIDKANARKVYGRETIRPYNLPLAQSEKRILLLLLKYPDVARLSAEDLDPAKIAQYLFELAQAFNCFYSDCPVLGADSGDVKVFRLNLIKRVEIVMRNGLYLLGMEAVEKM